MLQAALELKNLTPMDAILDQEKDRRLAELLIMYSAMLTVYLVQELNKENIPVLFRNGIGY